jgi:MarR family
VVRWTFLTSHARVLLLVAHDPGVRLRDIAASLDITERSAFGIITDLAEAGYVIKEKDGRRNRYHIQAHLPLPEPTSQERTVGEVLALLTGTSPADAGKPTVPAGNLGSGRDGQRPTAETGAGRAAGAPRGGPRRDSPRSAVPGGRRQAGT